ncbi:unnamed protein product [Ceutorhynchus assimilis]|uniref:Uncharacterized protein n=1 Tax=Ceutorhynchus assimilis TaxID=467358 RepID=A0A9P0DHZ5_9CUCU|nr:unnamed protein product [Ceutorhynchus assimilis]
MGACEQLNFDGFNYVIEILRHEKLCFGSTISRDTAPIGKGLSPFQKTKAPELFKQGPGSYDTEHYTSALYPILNKIRSKRGVATLANKEKRFKEKFIRTPSPGRYEVTKNLETKQAAAPFNIKSSYGRPENNLPGPGTYHIEKTKKCRRTRFMDNFGHPTMIYAVEFNCVPVPVDACLKCKEICKGDYWHRDYAVFLCHLCWEEERFIKELYTKQQLKEFKKIRNCSFEHNHEGCEAATLILPPNKLKKKLRLENYLDLYIDC